MGLVRYISVWQAQEWLSRGQARLIDIRDEQSFAIRHAVGAFHLSDATLSTFIQQTDFAMSLLVMCYHGNSSKRVAQYLLHQGFEQVCSIDGGFEAWQTAFPALTACGNEESAPAYRE